MANKVGPTEIAINRPNNRPPIIELVKDMWQDNKTGLKFLALYEKTTNSYTTK